MLTKEEIRLACMDEGVYQRGRQLYHSGGVTSIYLKECGDDVLELSAEVRGNGQPFYECEVILDRDTIDDYSCDCPAGMDSRRGMCKHCVALALAYQNSSENQDAPKKQPAREERSAQVTSPGLKNLMGQLRAPAVNLEQNIAPGSIQLLPEFSLQKDQARDWRSYLRSRYYLETSFRIAAGGRSYVVKNLALLVELVRQGQYYSYGKSLAFTHAREMFAPDSQKLLGAIRSELESKGIDLRDAAVHSGQNYRYLHLPDPVTSELLASQAGTVILLNGQDYLIQCGDPVVRLRFETLPGGARLILPKFTLLLAGAAPWICYDGCIYGVTEDFAQEALPLLETLGAVEALSYAIQEEQEYSLMLMEEDYLAFCSAALPKLAAVFPIEYGPVDFSAYQPEEPDFVFRITSDEAGGIVLRPEVHYGRDTYPLFVRGEEFRNLEAEQPVRTCIRTYFTQDITDPAQWRIQGDDALFHWLDTGLDAMREQGEVLIDSSLKNLRIAPAPRTTIGVALKGDLIDLDMTVEGMPQEEMTRLLTAYQQKKRYYRLQNGEFLSLEDGGLSVMHELADGLMLSGKDLEHATVPAFRAQYINAVTTGAGEVEVKRSAAFRQAIRSLHSFADSDAPVPEKLQASLRSYQEEGYRWMCALADCHLGGILADEMGLGKTIQSIAFLLHTQENALIVCPASLLYNWESEVRRFAPSLTVQTIRGTAAQRKALLQEEADVYITSYDLLKRDAEAYSERTFGTVLIDEAQYIRNAGTQAAQAVKKLQAKRRFALTGTPIENRLSDLWSIFDFLMPGFLYRYPQFKKTIEQPILSDDDTARLRLSRMVTPFLLRRKKSDVLRELPEKVEQVRYVDLTPRQQKLYQAQEQQLRQSLQKDDDKTFQANRIQYLSALTRLRQLCCDPALFLEDYDGGSGKVNACLDLLEELTQAGHKVLVFSQFTSMLDILRHEATARGLDSLCLTGANTKEQRRNMVRQFQEGEVMVFFISLKAGGVGLNLTAADRVIHIDPWWNAAAEDQASDRTHRIGQKNTVFITKLVAQHTVEERILALQEAKRALSDSVMSGEGVSSGQLSREELLALLEEG